LDNLTHSLVGLFLARAGFKRATAYGAAVMVVAANAPDADVISWFWGRPTWLHWHRNITHSLAGAPVMALLSVAVVALAVGGGRKAIRWWPAFLIALAGVASHLLLDLTNVYGVRLLLPFSGHWSHWDITPVLDFSVWAILLLGVVAPALSRLVGSEIGETGRDKGNVGWAVTVLLLLTVYDYTRNVFHERATNIMDAHIYNKLAPRRVGAFPTANPMQAAMTTYPFQMLLEFVQYPLWVIQPVADGDAAGTRVSLIDLRFGTPAQSGFAATAFVDTNNRVHDATFGMGEVRLR